MELTNIPQQKPDYKLEQLDDEILLYHPSDNRIMYFNQTASVIWELCNGERSVQDMVDLLSDAYPDAVESMEADITETIQKFLDHGCIELT